jgi:hypothetical protein
MKTGSSFAESEKRQSVTHPSSGKNPVLRGRRLTSGEVPPLPRIHGVAFAARDL